MIGSRVKVSARSRSSTTTLPRFGSKRSSGRSSGVFSVPIIRLGSATSGATSAAIVSASISGSSPCTLQTISSSSAGRDLGQPIRAGRVIGRGHLHREAGVLDDVGDALVVGRDQEAVTTPGVARRGHALGDVQDHRLAGQQEERLAGEAGRRVASRDDRGDASPTPVSRDRALALRVLEPRARARADRTSCAPSRARRA